MSDHNSEKDYDNVDFDVWYRDLKTLAAKYGENVSHVDSWREDFDEGISVEDSFYGEFDEHTRPAKAYTQKDVLVAKSSLSPVLNTDADQIVLLPLDHPLIDKGESSLGFIELIRERLPENQRHLVVQVKLSPDDSMKQSQTASTLNIPAIDDVNYSALVVALGLDGLGDEAGEDLFVRKSVEANSDKTINEQGYRFVYKQLRDNHMSLEHIFQNIPKYTHDLAEITPDSVLSELAVNYEDLGAADRLMVAVERLKDDVKKAYVTNYEVDANTIILYRVVA